MTTNSSSGIAEVRIGGKTLTAPVVNVCGQPIVATGRWLRIAQFLDEIVIEGDHIADAPKLIDEIRDSPLGADIFSFAQKLPETRPRYTYGFEWDNWAVVRLESFQSWWDALPQESRKNVRRAAKRGVIVRVAEFNDELVRGIHAIYKDTPVRQGKAFWHFGKSFDTVKREAGTYRDRSDFLGAYLGDELIGFLKVTYVDRVATLLHIISKAEHQDKRPTNALLAHTIELCEKRRMAFLTYGKYVYGRHTTSSLTEFKRRNGFEEVKVPRYIVPLTLKGRVAIRFGLHADVRERIPDDMLRIFLGVRAQAYDIYAQVRKFAHRRER